MKIIEFIKSSILARMLLDVLLLFVTIIMTFLSNFKGLFFYASLYFFLFGLYHIFNDIKLHLYHFRIVSIESKSRTLLWNLIPLLLFILFIIFMNNKHDSNFWIIVFIWGFINTIINEIRQRTLVISKDSIIIYKLFETTKIKLTNISNITLDSNIVNVQANNKDYIIIDLGKSSEIEKLKIVSIINEIKDKMHCTQHSV